MLLFRYNPLSRLSFTAKLPEGIDYPRCLHPVISIPPATRSNLVSSRGVSLPELLFFFLLIEVIIVYNIGKFQLYVVIYLSPYIRAPLLLMPSPNHLLLW